MPGSFCQGFYLAERGSDAKIPGSQEYLYGTALRDTRNAARIFERSEASKIVVFGSVQRGDDGPDSDIDLLVVLPHVSRRHDDAVRVLRELRDMPVPIDITVIDEASLDARSQEPGLVRAALREGRVLERVA